MPVKCLPLMLCAAMLGSGAAAEDLTIPQQAIVAEMRDTVLAYSVVNRLQDMCADVIADDARLSAHRDHVMSLAQDVFASKEAFMKAAGAGEQEKMGEAIRRFFLDRGVTWEDSADTYCALARALQAVKAPLSANFTLRD
ncbi:hypothetical protein [Szabonella alba]|uniref:Uncharacterized protein n=1 Tax=Szabonella alba TaxID=2804194 RepID=A0A8K0VCW0_9RHOB|nr:hypothetical protein [Szabonella alba]MBL4917525.1 hypothetical protein [Szabonella alba]